MAELFSQFDLGWLVGMIEGEGCLSCKAGYDKRDDRTRVMLRVTISTSSVPLRDNIIRVYNGMGVEYSIHVTKPKTYIGRDVYHINVQAHKSILKVLLPIVNYLLSGKKQIAQSMIDYIKNRLDKGGKEKYDDVDYYLANKIRSLCTEYNIKKGAKMGGEIWQV